MSFGKCYIVKFYFELGVLIASGFFLKAFQQYAMLITARFYQDHIRVSSSNCFHLVIFTCIYSLSKLILGTQSPKMSQNQDERIT